MTALLLLLLLPACAALAGLATWLAHRTEPLTDGSLLARFALMMGLVLLLAWGLVRTDAVRMRVDPSYRMAKEFSADPLVDVFRRTVPGDQRFPAFLLSELARGRTLAEARRAARPLLARLATERMGFADAPTQVAWGGLVRDSLAVLQARDPALCYAAMRHQDLDDDTLQHGFDAAEARAFEQAVIAVYESASQGMRHDGPPRAPRAGLEDARREFVRIKAAIEEQFGPQLASIATGKTFATVPEAPVDALCEARIAVLDAALAEPEPMAATLADALLR